MLQGHSIQPSGLLRSEVCDYQFLHGNLIFIHRKDLFVDRGPNSLILRHLTNEVLTLKTNDAANRALDVLRRLSFDADAVRKAYRIQVSDDLMDASPVRDGGPDFPKDLHFFGELISRKHIKIKVEFTPIDTNALVHAQSGGDMRIEFLATTGELLSARLGFSEALTALGVHAPAGITLDEASDFMPPVYFQASRKLNQPARTVSSQEAIALLDAAWLELQQKCSNNHPLCFLVCDDLNVPTTIAGEMNRLARGTPWAGVTHVWRNDLPFDAAQMDRLARQRRGIGIMAICGRVQTQLDRISASDSPSAPGKHDDAADKAMKWLNRISLSNRAPDHALFLFQPTYDPFAAAMYNELLSRTKDTAEIFNCMGSRPLGGGSQGSCYCNGQVLGNTVVVLSLSGSLPLQMDPASWLQQRPERRLVSWEVGDPIEQFAFSFGPHPMAELFNYLGPAGVRFLQQADRVETFNIKSNSPDDWSLAGKPAIEGHEIIKRGKTWGRDFAQQLAAVLLNENDFFGGIHSCIWAPRYAYRFWCGKESATWLVCFDCNEVEINFYAPGNKLTHSAAMDFGDNRDSLLKFTEKAFPDERKLKEQEPH
jgi:hypothetical protein